MKKTDKQIFGLIGYPVKHSLSPLMHNAAFKQYGIPAEYRLFEIKPEKLEEFLLADVVVEDTKGEQVPAGDICGFNITIPHKVRARQILEKKFPLVQGENYTREDLHYLELTGAINTVKRQAGGLCYWNTDAYGFLMSLSEDLKFNAEGKSALLIGCGGAGRAVVAALSWKNTEKIYVYDASPEAAESARAHFYGLPVPGAQLKDKLIFIESARKIAEVIPGCDLLINATAVGMKDSDPCPVDEKFIRSGLSVYDLIYNPRETKLLKISREKGAMVSNGLGMLLYQGKAAFEHWTGKPAPVELMRKALEEGADKK